MGDESAMSGMSGMSQMSSVSETSSMSKGPDESRERSTNMCLLLLIVVILIILLLGLGIYLVTTSGTGAQGATGGEDSSSSSGPGGYVKPTTEAKANDTKSSGGGTGGTTSPPGPNPLADRRYLLLCTVTYHALDKIQYPPDNLCNILFYTNAYYEPNKNDFVGSKDTNSFDLFRSQARSANTKMAYGVSFEYQYAKNTSLAISDKEGKSKFKKLWDDNIHHYGILQAWDEPPAMIAANTKLDLMKELKTQTEEIKEKKEVEMVLGFQFPNGIQLVSVKDVAEHLIATYPITVLVAMTHLFVKKKLDLFYFSNGPSTWDGCAMKENGKVDCPHVMKDIGTQLKAITSKENVTIMVSFTMSGAYWRINNAAYIVKTNVDFNLNGYWKSRDFTRVEYSQSCVENFTEPNRLDKAGDFMYTGSGDNWFLLAFDTPETLERKMEKFFDLMGPRPGRRGWAVYDVDYDDYTNVCKSTNNFQGLRAVSKYLRSEATSTTDANL